MSPTSGPLASRSLIAACVLSSVIAGLAGIDRVALAVAVTAGPVGGVPVTVAVLLTTPAFTSAWVRV